MCFSLNDFNFNFKDVANRQSLPRGVIKHVKELRTLSLKNTEATLEKVIFTHSSKTFKYISIANQL